MAIDPPRSLGYLYDHPLAIEARNDPRNWPMSLLMDGQPYQVPPAHYLHPGFPDEPLDQDGIGACVAFAGETIQNANEYEDEGPYLFKTGVWTGGPSSTGAFRCYYDLKHGYGSYPGDGIPDAEGSFPEALWRLALLEGLPDISGKRHKISAYYSHQFASDLDFEFLQQVILTFGPVNLGIPWPGNWMASPPGPYYKMPAPGGFVGGHSITVGGWDIWDDGVKWLTNVQTWGRFGGPKGTYRIRADWLYTAPMGPQIIWKTVDIEEAPTPPTPDPEGPMLAILDRIPRLVDCPLAAQVYKLDGTTPLVQIKSGNLGISSLAKLDQGYYLILVSIGGLLNLGAIKDVTNVRVMADPSVAVAAEKKRWTDWLETHPI